MNKTKIDWCDSTWNPVTGCLHGCEYCYARGIAKRFKGCDIASTYNTYGQATWKRLNPHEENEKALFEVLEECPPVNVRFDKIKQKQVITKAPYPFGFKPTLRRDRLEEYVNKKGRTIFVCSMADLFGTWVPDEWIETVFNACDRAPQHKYLFLTKNPGRYTKAMDDNYKDYIENHMSNFWFGVTVATKNDTHLFNCLPAFGRRFVSIEPLLEDLETDKCNLMFKQVHWVIIGAETGKRKNKIIPERKWIEDIVKWCKEFKTPIFMKSSLSDIWGEPLMQEFPKQLMDKTEI